LGQSAGRGRKVRCSSVLGQQGRNIVCLK
jgi:hypothetical protein